jgi:tetratricopeptide (TPR) repeat protein
VHDRLVTLNRLGDAQAALNDHAAAVETYREMVIVGNRLLDIDAYSTDWANDLGIALERLGTSQGKIGDRDGALKSYRDCLALRDWLVNQDSSNVVWYRNLAVVQELIATTLAAENDYQTALEHQEESLRLMRDLAAAFPDDPWYKIDVVRALDQKAVLLQDGTTENREALAILEEMYAAGTLPQGYEDWIPAFRKTLGLPSDF